jgi:hypothetical protein
MQWMDRSGHALGALETTLRDPTFARDGRSVVGGGDGVWLVDLERGAPTRLVQDGMAPWPSPDGLRVAFTSRRKGGVADIFVRSAGLDDEVLLESPEHKIVNDWTADGRFLVYVSTNRETGKDIWLLPMTGARTPVPFLVTPYNEIQAQVSPDGRWLAYASDESGSWEVYVQAFPGGGGKRAISVGGGAQPKWRGDGGELFYLGADHRLMAVAVSDAPIPGFGRPTPLFRAPVSGDLNAYRSHYAVSADGDRFLIDTLDASTNREPITLLVNWSQVLEP